MSLQHQKIYMVMPSAYSYVHTDYGSRGRNLSGVGKGVIDMYVHFVVAQINHFRDNQWSCSSKNLDSSFVCSTYSKIFRNKFLRLCFLGLGHAFGHTPGTSQVKIFER